MDSRARKFTRWLLILISVGIAMLALAVLSYPLQAAPVEQSTWDNMGIYGGNIMDALFDPATGWVYAISDGPVYRSTDNGDRWDPLPGLNVGGSKIQIGADGALYTNHFPGLRRSEDNGETWTNLAAPDEVGEYFNFQGFSLDPGNVQHIVAGTMRYESEGGKIFTTLDGGMSWQEAAIDVPAEGDISGVAIDPAHPNLVYAINTSLWFPNTPSYIYRSQDGGLQFQKVLTATAGVQFQDVNVNTLGVAFAVGGDGVYRSPDGVHWSLVSNFSGSFVGFNPLDPDTVYIDGARSEDGGDNWEGGWGFNSFLALSPTNPNLMFTKSVLGIQRSMDAGLTWEESVQGIERAVITGVAADALDSQILYITSGNGEGRSLDGGKTWEFPLPGLGNAEYVVVDPQQAGVVYVGDGNGNVDKSMDFGQTWQSYPVYPPHPAAIWEIAVDPANTNRLYAAAASMPVPAPPADGGLYRSEDGGMTWITTTLEGLPVNTVQAAATFTGTVVYAGAGDYWMRTVMGGVYRSDDNGLSWQPVGFQDQVVNTLAINPVNPRIVFAGLTESNWGVGLNQPFYRSTDGGETWEKLNLIVTGSAETIVIDPNNPNVVYVSSGVELYKSRDGGDTWEKLPWDWEETAMQIQAILIPYLPPSPVAKMETHVEGNNVGLTWENPGDPDLEGIHIRFMTDTFPTAHTQGISLTTQTDNILPGDSGVFTHTNLISGTTYYYSLFAFDTDGRYSEPASISATLPLTLALDWPAASRQSARPLASSAPQNYVYVATSKGLFRSYSQWPWNLFLPFVIH